MSHPDEGTRFSRPGWPAHCMLIQVSDTLLLHCKRVGSSVDI